MEGKSEKRYTDCTSLSINLFRMHHLWKKCNRIYTSDYAETQASQLHIDRWQCQKYTKWPLSHQGKLKKHQTRIPTLGLYIFLQERLTKATNFLKSSIAEWFTFTPRVVWLKVTCSPIGCIINYRRSKYSKLFLAYKEYTEKDSK